MMWVAFELGINLYQTTLLIETVSACLEKRWTGLKLKITKGITILLLFLELSFVNSAIPFEGIAIIIPIFMIFIYTMIVLKGFWLKKLYLSTISMLAILITTVFVLNIMGYVCGYSYISMIENKDNVRFICLITIQLIIFYMSRFLIKHHDSVTGKVSWDVWLVAVIMPLLSVIALAAVLTLSINLKESYQKQGVKIIVLITLGILCINIVVYWMHSKLTRDYKERLEYELLKHKYNIREADIQEIKELYQNLRKVKHDIKQHINVVKAMLYDNKGEEAIRYLEEYEKSEYSGNRDKVYSKNEFVNYIINSKIESMDRYGIKFYCVTNNQIDGISEVELSIILGNLLDNAIEACINLRCDKTISLYIEQYNGYLIIKIENTIDFALASAENILNLESKKVNKKEHGIGIYSIKDVVNKYGGNIKFSIEDNKFVCTIVIDTNAK